MRTLLKSEWRLFLFQQDDVVLNPKFTGHDSEVHRLKIDEGGAFLPGAQPLGGQYNWHYALLAHIWKNLIRKHIFFRVGSRELACAVAASKRSISRSWRTKYGFNFSRHRSRRTNRTEIRFRLDPGANDALNKAILDGLFKTAPDDKITLPFPFLFAMSDFFAVDRVTLDRARHTLGVFSAMLLFPEFAIPTALYLVAPQCNEQRHYRVARDMACRTRPKAH